MYKNIISNYLNNLIKDEIEAIQGYNSAIIELKNYPKLVETFQDIANEEYAHIGELQKLLEDFDNGVFNIKEGKNEVIEKNSYFTELDNIYQEEENNKLLNYLSNIK